MCIRDSLWSLNCRSTTEPRSFFTIFYSLLWSLNCRSTTKPRSFFTIFYSLLWSLNCRSTTEPRSFFTIFYSLLWPFIYSKFKHTTTTPWRCTSCRPDLWKRRDSVTSSKSLSTLVQNNCRSNVKCLLRRVYICPTRNL